MTFKPEDSHQDEKYFNDVRFSEAGFEAFFKQLYPALCVHCRFKYGFDIELAEDVVHSGFMKLWEIRQSLATVVSAKSYLYKIVDNHSLNLLKHERVKSRHQQYILNTCSDSGASTTFDSVDLKQMRLAIDIAVSELPDQMRKIFELSRYEGYKYLEIARHLNISVKTVETQMSRALVKLKQKLSGYFPHIIFMHLLAF